ncbi:MAG: MFS transporter [Solirubrobacterales bacterium]
MRGMTGLLRSERRLRWFFAAHLQGALGAGAGYVALMVLAYDRIGSAWGATAVLLADFLPAMLLGPLLGSLIDRTSRLGGAVLSDLIRAVAFAGLVFADGTLALVAFALLAGFGTALFRPATYALLPSLVGSDRVKSANALYLAVRDAGQLLGLMLAAALLAISSPELVLGLNAVTFALSALLLTRLRGQVRAVVTPTSATKAARNDAPGLLRDRFVRTLVITSGLVTLCAAMMNIGELVLAQQDLDAGATGFALLTAAYGLGLIGGTLCAGRDGGDTRVTFFVGLGGVAAGMLGTALAPGLGFAMCTFAFTGAANGLFCTSKTTMLHRAVPERAHGRAFGLLDSLDSWGFGLAVVAGGALATAFGGRWLFAISGVLLALVFVGAAFALRHPRAGRLTSPVPV